MSALGEEIIFFKNDGVNNNASQNNSKSNVISKSEKMKTIRSAKFERFNQMRDRAVKDVKEQNYSPCTQIGHMGPVKAFGDL